MATDQPPQERTHLKLIASPEMYFIQGFLGTFPALTAGIPQPENALQVSILPPEPGEFVRLAVDLWKEPTAHSKAENLQSFLVSLHIPELINGIPTTTLREVEITDHKNVTTQGKVKTAKLTVDMDQNPIGAGSTAARMLVEWLLTGQMPDMGAYATEGQGLQTLH